MLRASGVGDSSVKVRIVGMLAIFVLAVGCRSRRADPSLGRGAAENGALGSPSLQLGSVPPTSNPVERSPTPPRRLEGKEPFIALEVSGFGDAVVGIPIGATGRRPILVALHGNFDRPNWQCEVWRQISGGFPFVLCPRGIARRDVPKRMDRWEWSNTEQTDRELQAAIAALNQEYGDFVAKGPILLAGFSLGAILEVGILMRHPGQFGPVVLVEGGQRGWSRAAVQRIFLSSSDTGVVPEPWQRVLFACGQWDCLKKSRPLVKRLERGGVEAKVVHGRGAGHTYDGTVAEAIGGEWKWLISGDERWAGSAAAID